MGGWVVGGGGFGWIKLRIKLNSAQLKLKLPVGAELGKKQLNPKYRGRGFVQNCIKEGIF